MESSKHYILKGKEVVSCDLHTWVKMMESPCRVLQRTSLPTADISTVFLGIDYRFGGRGIPLLFESMIFGGGDLDEHQDRYSTWDEAWAGHWSMVGQVAESDLKKVGIMVVLREASCKKGFTLGHGSNAAYHTKLLELYTKMYENAPRLYLSADQYPKVSTRYDVCVEGDPQDLADALKKLSDLVLIYPCSKWEEEHEEEK